MLTYIGRGYSPGFTANYDGIAQRLSSGEEIELISGPDDICAPLLCSEKPHCHQKSVLRRDDQAANAIADLLQCPLGVGSRITFDAELLARMRQAFARHTIRRACLGCEWFDLCTTVADEGFPGARIAIASQSGQTVQPTPR